MTTKQTAANNAMLKLIKKNCNKTIYGMCLETMHTHGAETVLIILRRFFKNADEVYGAFVETKAKATQYANKIGWSDVEPFEVVKVISTKTMEIRRMDAMLDPTWKPEIIPGGFVGHCVNQHTQRYTITSNVIAPIVRIRLNSKGQWKDAGGNKYNVEDAPRKFYDYNF
jgi:hypothetical protein